MNRRSFIFKLAASILGAPLAAKLAPTLYKPLVILSEDAMDAMLYVEADRLRGEILKTIMRQSPYFTMLEAGTFPEAMGDAVRVITKERTHVT